VFVYQPFTYLSWLLLSSFPELRTVQTSPQKITTGRRPKITKSFISNPRTPASSTKLLKTQRTDRTIPTLKIPSVLFITATGSYLSIAEGSVPLVVFWGLVWIVAGFRNIASGPRNEDNNNQDK